MLAAHHPPMLTIKATGSIQDMVRSVRDVPVRVVPYATSTALTRVAKIAQTKDLPAEMNRVFDRPTPYALNSLFVKPASVDNLSARVMVKDQAATGIVPERFLLPEVAGGLRGEKRVERALRFGGWLHAGERIIPARDMPRDAFGNVSGPKIKAILTQLEKPSGRSTRRGRGGKLVSVGRYADGLFAGLIGKTRGIWQRTGRKVKPLFIFTSKVHSYDARLDFTGISEAAALRNFPVEFNRAMREIQAKGAR